MNKKVIISMIVIFAIIVLAIGGYFIFNSTKEVSNINDLPVYTYEEDDNYTNYTEMAGIEFSYPSNYKSVGTSTQPTFMDPEIQGASVNLVSDNSQNLPLENYMDLSIENIKKVLTVNGEIEKEYINLNGVKAGKIVYEATQSGINMKLTQVVIIKDSKAYILTIGSLPKDNETMQEKTDKMIKSFK